MSLPLDRGWPPGRLRAFLLAILLVILDSSKGTTHSQTATLGVLVDLHEAGGSGGCGPLNLHSYQKLKAVEWAAETINNKSWPGEFNLDLSVHDSCGESGVASSETARLLKWSKDNLETPLIGMIVIGSRNNEIIIDRPLESLNNENISAIVTSARAAGLILSNHPNVFTTAPDISSVTEGIVALLNQLGASDVAIISSSTPAIKKLQRLATKRSIKAEKTFCIQKGDNVELKEIVKFIEEDAANVQSVVLLLESTELESLISDGDSKAVEKFQKLVSQKSWILGSVGMDNELVKDWSLKFQVNLLIMQPRVSTSAEFQTYFVDKLMDSIATKMDDEALQFVEATHHCQVNSSKGKNSPLTPSCSSLTRSAVSKKVHQESDIGFIVNAISAFSAALRLAQISCTMNGSSCNNSHLSSEVLAALRNLNLPIKDVRDSEEDLTTESTVSSSHEIEGTQQRINYHGKLISRKYDLLLSRNNGKLTKIGQYSHEDGLVLDVMLGGKFEGGTSMQDPGDKKKGTKKGKNYSGISQEYLREEGAVDVRRMMSPPEMYISRVWAMVAIAVAITGVFISMYMLVYVLQRMCDGTLRGNQVLGILLLLGIIMMYSSVVLFVLPPGTLLCNFKVFLPSLATAICFGILMLKAMQLRSLVSLGLGGRVPVINQFITLLFIVGAQGAINLQWFFGPHEDMKVLPGTLFQECFYSHNAFLYLHSYIGILILIVFSFGISVLKIRRNYNEAKWITLAACLSIPLAVAWTVVVHLGPGNFQEPAACAFFISTATVLLFSIFIPKLNTISMQSKVGKRMKEPSKGSGGGPYGGSISTIFTTLSDRGTLQSQMSHKRNSADPHASRMNTGVFIPPPPPMPSSNHTKSVTYSPRLTTNFYHSSSAATSLARSASMKTPFFRDAGRAAYP